MQCSYVAFIIAQRAAAAAGGPWNIINSTSAFPKTSTSRSPRNDSARPVRTLLLAAALLAGVQSLSAQVAFKVAGGDHISIDINGQPFSTFYIGSSYPKPFLAPLRTATGVIITRKFPMDNVDGESRDHPHHRGLFLGFHDVNGVNFWENEFTYTTPNRGRIVTRHIGEVTPGKKSGRIVADFEWRDPAGSDMIDEHRIMTFSGDAETRTIDIDLTLTAKIQARFADDKDGFFAIRVADSMAEKNGGLMTNSEGAQTEKDVWGKRADWVDYDGVVEGAKVGIAILDHPQNDNHPPRWHSRAYGLFAVNPFMVKDVDPKSTEAGGYTMAAGSSLHFRYRVIIHAGDVPMKTVASWYSDYQKKAK